MTEKLRTHIESEIRTENEQKSNAADAALVVTKNVGRPRKKRRASDGSRIDWVGKSGGDEHLVDSDTPTRKVHHKRSCLVEEVETVNYMLPEERNKTMASFFL